MATSKTDMSILGGKFTFKPNSIIVCNICKWEFKYHLSTSLITYHLHCKHLFSARDQLMTSANFKPSQHQPTLSVLIELIEKAKPMKQCKFDAILKALARWIATNGRQTNIVTVEGLQDVISTAANNQSHVLPSIPVIYSRVDDLFKSEKVVNSKQAFLSPNNINRLICLSNWLNMDYVPQKTL